MFEPGENEKNVEAKRTDSSEARTRCFSGFNILAGEHTLQSATGIIPLGHGSLENRKSDSVWQPAYSTLKSKPPNHDAVVDYRPPRLLFPTYLPQFHGPINCSRGAGTRINCSRGAGPRRSLLETCCCLKLRIVVGCYYYCRASGRCRDCLFYPTLLLPAPSNLV